jgi:2-pyrone-4,6-dicarboxylate lactonase
MTFKPPDPTCDCHVHVFDPSAHPYVRQRRYTPGTATANQLELALDNIGASRVVLVQPSVYGTNNECMLEAIDVLGKTRARGVAVVDLNSASVTQLRGMHARGVRGLRLNFEVEGVVAQDLARRQVAQAGVFVKQMGWSLHVHANLSLIKVLAKHLTAINSPIVLDHYAGIKAGDWQQIFADPGFRDLIDHDQTYIKLSAPYKVTAMLDRIDVNSIHRAFFERVPTRTIWGTDWPHTGGAGGGRLDPYIVEPFRIEDDRLTLERLANSLGSCEAAKTVLVDNPAVLFGF